MVTGRTIVSTVDGWAGAACQSDLRPVADLVAGGQGSVELLGAGTDESVWEKAPNVLELTSGLMMD